MVYLELCTEKCFREKQLLYLKENGRQVLDGSGFLSGLDNPDTFPEKSALITFDDGYRFSLKIAAPILKKFSYPAIVFVPTAFIKMPLMLIFFLSRRNLFVPGMNFVNWKGMEYRYNSHSVSHPHFSRLSAEELFEEIHQSKKVLEANLDKEIHIFSFPYSDEGRDREETKSILRQAGYKAACLYGSKPGDSSVAHRFGLPRIAVGPDTVMEEIIKNYST